jgi:DNA-binding PadR family transcriptional regulator
MKKQLLKLSPLTEATFYILLALKDPLHGYGIIKQVEDMTNKRLKLAAGTLYGVIQKLLKYKLIYLYSELNDSKNKKEYLITDEGLELLNYEVKRFKEMIKNASIRGE